jgi:hypothetical protein
MHKILLVPLLSTLAGCSLVRDMARPFLPKSDSVPVVAPSFSLHGRAVRMQDSLRPRLEWIATQTTPDGTKLVRLAFHDLPDSNMELLATIEDSRRLNSHGLDGQGIRAVEAARIGKERPLLGAVRSAGIALPFVVRAVFVHRDYLFQNSHAVRDSVEVGPPDGPVPTDPD